MSKILNRQNMLWEGSRMFLPEHREALLEKRRRMEDFIPPELDEDRLLEINRFILEASENDNPIVLHYAENHRSEQICGFIEKINPDERWIRIANGRIKRTIRFEQIFGAETP